mmetsp:Transcript_2013/g.6429  ORF Transcript_2013/g.6429 Transcript_2013/m.6429 type:complete len:222 (-) Transcript_2013:433-1098(-)
MAAGSGGIGRREEAAVAAARSAPLPRRWPGRLRVPSARAARGVEARAEPARRLPPLAPRGRDAGLWARRFPQVRGGGLGGDARRGVRARCRRSRGATGRIRHQARPARRAGDRDLLSRPLRAAHPRPRRRCWLSRLLAARPHDVGRHARPHAGVARGGRLLWPRPAARLPPQAAGGALPRRRRRRPRSRPERRVSCAHQAKRARRGASAASQLGARRQAPR